MTSTSTDPLSVIVPLDPIWVRIQMTENQYLAYGKRKATGQDGLQLILADGSTFPHTGRLDTVLNEVDPKTGTLEVQARFPNPNGRVLPGQFGHVRFQTDERKDVIMVPQRAVQQIQSLQTIYTVSADNKAESRAVKTSDRVGDNWIIDQGLKVGDKVIVEGLMRVQARHMPPCRRNPSSRKAGQ